MNYVFCRVRHNPPESYGDCIRACVASLLSLSHEDVPHFFHDGCSGEAAIRRIREWAGPRGLAPVFLTFDGSATREEFLDQWEEMNPGVAAILIAATNYEDHAVIIVGNQIEHNPSVTQSPIIRANSNGCWNLLLFTKYHAV